MVKNPPAIRETWVRSLGLEDALENGTAGYPLQNSPILWPGEFHGQRSLAGSVHGVAKSDTTERLSHT